MLRNPKKFNDLVKAWSKLKIECGESFPEWETEGMDGRLARAQWGRAIRTKKIPTARLNRCGEIFCGPIFVSEKHPWPESEGMHMLPLIQINLDKWGRIMKMDFGTGILQVWACQVDIMKQNVRVLPPEDVKKEYLVRKIPEPVMEIYDDYPNSIPITWRKNDEGTSWAITGYEERHFAVQLWEDDINDIAESIEEACEPKQASAVMSPQKAKKIMTLIAKFKKLGMEAVSDFKTWSCCIGGSFSPIQYFAYERPPVLMNIGSTYELYSWGDGGNAQLFYEKQPDGSFEYSFEWSCT